jgi:hypothetical protein
MARDLGLPEEMIKLCTTSSAYHVALKEMKSLGLLTGSAESLTKAVGERFAEVSKDLRKIALLGLASRGAVAAAAPASTNAALAGRRARATAGARAVMDSSDVAGGGITAAAAPALRTIEGGGESSEVAALLGADTSGSAAGATAAPLVAQARVASSR